MRNLIPFENIEGPPKLLIDIPRLHSKTTFYLYLALLFFDFFYYPDASNILDTVCRLLFLGYKYRSFVSIVSDILSSLDFGSEDKPFWLHCIWTSPGMMYALFSWYSVNLKIEIFKLSSLFKICVLRLSLSGFLTKLLAS